MAAVPSVSVVVARPWQVPTGGLSVEIGIDCNPDGIAYPVWFDVGLMLAGKTAGLVMPPANLVIHAVSRTSRVGSTVRVDALLARSAGQWSPNFLYVTVAPPENVPVLDGQPAFTGRLLLNSFGGLRAYRFEACDGGQADVFAGLPTGALLATTCWLLSVVIARSWWAAATFFLLSCKVM